MTKKRNLTTFMIAIIIMLFSLPVNAQGTEGYAQKGHGDRYIGSLFRVDEPVPDDSLYLEN